jgi:hypothetical protein
VNYFNITDTTTEIKNANPMQLLNILMSWAEKIAMLLTSKKRKKKTARISGKNIIFFMLTFFTF